MRLYAIQMSTPLLGPLVEIVERELPSVKIGTEEITVLRELGFY